MWAAVPSHAGDMMAQEQHTGSRKTPTDECQHDAANLQQAQFFLHTEINAKEKPNERLPIHWIQ